MDFRKCDGCRDWTMVAYTLAGYLCAECLRELEKKMKAKKKAQTRFEWREGSRPFA